jgi:4-amino-4-deoxy-L-arabinose transferase-like glycosyltransferase
MGNLDRWIAGSRGAVLAALVALASGVLGLIGLPALDRNESAFVQATVQMLESGDFTAVRYQDYWRGGASPGAHWLQAVIVDLVSAPEARAIWAYRLASLFSVAAAAGVLVWGGAPLFGPRASFIAGVSLSVALVVSTAAGVATADAPFLAACAFLLAGFARVYAAASQGERLRRRDRALLWAGVVAGVILKGPMVLAIAGLAGLLLWLADRRAPWFRMLGWGWGLLALFALAGPWTIAVTVATDGAYWSSAGRPPPPWSPPLWQTWLSPLMAFPLSALMPLAAVYAARSRREPGVRVALAWLLAAWAVVELTPQKQVFGPLPVLLPLAWLGAAGLLSPKVGATARTLSAALALGAGLVLAVLAVVGSQRFGVGADLIAGLACAGLFAATALAAAFAVRRLSARRMMLVAGALAALSPSWLLGVTVPSLDRLWPTQRIMRALAANDLDPRKGLAVGPVAAAGYQEPSLVFSLGASTETGGGEIAAQAIADGRPAIVEAGEEPAFRTGLRRLGATAEAIGRIEAYDYAAAREIAVTVYRAAP